MSQHDNGRRAGGTQSGAWQQGQRDQQDHSNAQQDQSSGGRYGSQVGGGQQGGHSDPGGARGHQDQYDYNRGQQGDNWRERQGPAAGGWRPAMEERDRGWDAGRGGQGSFGGQASDNDYGNRGITESGNFGNYRGQRDNYGTLSGQGRQGQGGNYDQGGQSAQRFGGYRHGYDARTDSTGGYGSGNYGPDNAGGADWNAQRAWRDEARTRDDGSTYGQSYHDPDYHQWRGEQLNRLDRDYDEWRQHRYQRFAQDFDNWRANRDNNPGGQGPSAQAGSGTQSAAAGDTSVQQGGTSRQDASSGGDKGAGKTATQ